MFYQFYVLSVFSSQLSNCWLTFGPTSILGTCANLAACLRSIVLQPYRPDRILLDKQTPSSENVLYIY